MEKVENNIDKLPTIDGKICQIQKILKHFPRNDQEFIILNLNNKPRMA